MSQQFSNEAVLPAPRGTKSRGFLIQIFRDLIEAIRGSEQDFTQGSIGRAIFLLSIPMVLEMLMESVFAVVDIFFVSRLGAGAIAGVGLTESMMTIVYAIAFGISMATTAIIARRIGEKNAEDAAVAAIQSIIYGVVASLPVMLLGIVYGSHLLQLMGASSEVIAISGTYTSIMLGSNVIVMLIFVINAIFRGAGDAFIAMRVLWLANLLNIILDPCLILGLGPFPELGMKGAAIATAIGRGTGVLYQLSVLARGFGRVKIRGHHLKPDFQVLKRLFQVSLGGIGQFIIATSSWVGLVRIIAVFGSDALAAYTVAIRIILFSILPAWGMSNSAATLVGQNLGAKKPKRAERSVWLTAFINMFFLIGVAVTFIAFAENLIRIFTEEPAIVTIGSDCLRIISYGYLFYAFGMVMTQAFNGAGDTRTPTVINFFCFWMLEIPLAYFLALKAGFGLYGVIWSIVIAESSLGIIGVILFRRGKWKLREV